MMSLNLCLCLRKSRGQATLCESLVVMITSQLGDASAEGVRLEEEK